MCIYRKYVRFAGVRLFYRARQPALIKKENCTLRKEQKRRCQKAFMSKDSHHDRGEIDEEAGEKK